MMKKIWITVLLVMCMLPSNGQTKAEWLNQKATQKKYLLEQIAALKVYTNYLQKGYQIAKGGLNGIGDRVASEFGLHGNYFLSLSMVNPIVKKHPEVKAILSLQSEIDKMMASLIKGVQKSEQISPKERKYIIGVLNRLLADCERVLDELLTITTDRKAELKDEERIEWLNRLHIDMESNLAFMRKFGVETKAIQQARQRQQREIETGKVLTGIK